LASLLVALDVAEQLLKRLYVSNDAALRRYLPHKRKKKKKKKKGQPRRTPQATSPEAQ